MKTTLERTVEKLNQRFEEANWGKITITMKCNGDQLEIVPCSYGKATKETVEYFLVYGGQNPWLGSDTIEKLAQELIDYSKIVKEHEEEVAEIKAWYKEHIAGGNYSDDEWSWYSDWHKDVFGYRPRGCRCGAA